MILLVEMWSPTHVQLTVLGARNLISKGKGGTNNAFVTIQLDKEKFQTTVLENITDPVWGEECDLTFKDSKSSIILNVFHQNFFGLDEFLGQVIIPLSECRIYDNPKTNWFSLKNKPGKKDDRNRGELELKISFTVRDLASIRKDQEPKRTLSGSLLDVASAVGHKIQKLPSRSLSLKLDHLDSRLNRFRSRRSSPATEDNASTISFGSTGSSDQQNSNHGTPKSLRQRSMSLTGLSDSRQNWNGVKDYDSSFASEDLPAITESPRKNLNDIFPNSKRQRSNSSSFSKLSNMAENSMKRTISVPGSNEMSLSNVNSMPHSVSYDNWNELRNTSSNEQFQLSNEIHKPRKLRLARLRNSGRRHTIQEVDLPDSLLEESCTTTHRTMVDDENFNNRKPNISETIPLSLLEHYDAMTQRELLTIVLKQQQLIQMHENKIKDLELYIDNLLVRVMETQPRILQNPYKASGSAKLSS